MTKPNVETDAAVLEIRSLKQEVDELKKLLLEDRASGDKDGVDGGT